MDVRLEFTAAVRVDATRVARFVQELPGVPADAWCDVRNVWAASPAQPATVVTTAQLSCERRVADFLCQRFAAQTRHVSQGELLLVRCRRVCLRSLPTDNPRGKDKLQATHSVLENEIEMHEKTDQTRRPAALPRATMVDLLDCLGDQIVDVLEAFQAFAEPSEDESPRLSMVGVVQALTKLCAPAWKIASKPLSSSARADAKQSKNSKDTEGSSADQLAIHKARHLISQLIAGQAVALLALPEKNDTPFMVYTDFIACYVAYMSSSSDASSATHGSATSGSSDVKRSTR